jgi:hypothetical protein
MIVATAVSLKVEVNPFRRSNGQRTQKISRKRKEKTHAGVLDCSMVYQQVQRKLVSI